MSEKVKNLQPKQSGKPAMEDGRSEKPVEDDRSGKSVEDDRGSWSHFTVGVVACCREAKLKGKRRKDRLKL